jgi:hypothetical protein
VQDAVDRKNNYDEAKSEEERQDKVVLEWNRKGAHYVLDVLIHGKQDEEIAIHCQVVEYWRSAYVIGSGWKDIISS